MFQLSIHCPEQHFQKVVAGGKLILGSSTKNTEPEFQRIDDSFLAERQLELEYLPSKNLVKLTNFGRAVILQSGQRVLRDKDYLLTIPSRLFIGKTVIEVSCPKTETSIDDALVDFEYREVSKERSKKSDRAPSISKLSLWFEAIAEFQQTVAGTDAFFMEAAKCAFDPGGLDSALVVRKIDGDWQIAASYVPSPELGIGFQSTIVERAAANRKTVFHDSNLISSKSYRNDADFVVAAPVFDDRGEVAAVLYASRSMKRANNRIGIRPMEAMFVNLIAKSVTSGLSRLKSESRAAQGRALLEQAFSPQVAEKLVSQPEILEAREEEVTVLFADLRGFTSIAEQAGTQLTYQLLSDLMNRFTQIVMNQNGVILDYFGDGLAAFWNAPINNPHHPSLACESGLQLLEEMSSINQTWSGRLGKKLRVGIGIHTGVAQVGNSGSQWRLKYGPRGNAVNLAQRIETATKPIGLPILISSNTAERLDSRFLKRRVCRTRVPGIEEPVSLIQPFHEEHVGEEQRKGLALYEAALKAFEYRDLTGAMQLLVKLESDNHNDYAAEYLLKQITTLRSDDDWNASSDPATEPYQPLLSNQAIQNERESAPTVPLN